MVDRYKNTAYKSRKISTGKGGADSLEQVVFGIHTATAKHLITQKESNAVKKFFGVDIDKPLEDETHFYERGVTKIWIQEISNKRGIRYYLYMQINFTRTLGIGTHKIMPYSIANMKKAIKAVNRILKLLPLLDKNNKFQDWTAERIDTTFDIYEQHTPLLMQLLNDSLDLSNTRKRCERLPIPDKTPEQLKSESMRFGNDSYVYNTYAKLTEVLQKAEKNGRTVTQEETEETQNILRIERQNHTDAVKKMLPHRKVADLTDDKVRTDILRIMIDEIALFFGTSDFYSWEQIKKVYYPNHKADIDMIKDVMKQATLNSLEAAQDDYIKVADTFNNLGLSPVGIKKDDVKQHGVHFVEGIYSRITAVYPRPPDKRQYNSFPVPHQTGDGRFKATITLYDANSGRKQIQIAGKTVEDYENKVFCKLVSTYIVNRAYLESDDSAQKDLALKSADSILRFCKVAKTTAVKQGTMKFIKNLKLDSTTENSTGDNPNPSATGGGLTISDNPNNI